MAGERSSKSPLMDSERIKVLTSKARNGDMEAMNELLQIHRSHLVGVAYTILKDRPLSEDAVQQAMIQIFKNIRALHPELKFKAWASTITRNESLAMIKSNLRWTNMSDHTEKVTPAPPRDPTKTIYDFELRNFIRRSLNAINQEHKQALLVCTLQGKSVKELAETAHCPYGTALARVFRGKREFRRIFKELISEVH